MSDDEDAGYCVTKGEPSKGRHNFREEHPEAYNRWRKQRDYAEEHAFFVSYDPKTKRRRLVAVPRIPGGKEARERAQKRTDEHLMAYIKQVEAGTWPTKRVPITDAFRDGERDDGLPITIEVLKDPLCFAGQDKNGNRINSIERALERIEASGETEAGYPLHPTDGDLPMRPLRESSKFDWADNDGWRLSGYDDPANDWVDAMDRRGAKTAHIKRTLTICNEDKRLAKLDTALNAFSRPGDDPAFASLLLEWVADQQPGYQLHSLAKMARKSACQEHVKLGRICLQFASGGTLESEGRAVSGILSGNPGARREASIVPVYFLPPGCWSSLTGKGVGNEKGARNRHRQPGRALLGVGCGQAPGGQL